MSTQVEDSANFSERMHLDGACRVYRAAAIVGAAALGVSLLLGLLSGQGAARFYFAYLVSFSFFLSIALGALFFVMLQHLTHAGWSVGVRRVAEALSATLPALAALALPIAISVIVHKGQLYPWAQAEVDAVVQGKRAFLNPAFFLVRLGVYFAVWSGLALWYWRTSAAQDASGEVALTRKMEALAGPAMIAYAITVTLASVDLIMSLDPHWFSTIFGVYYFAGSAVALFATLAVAFALLGRLGYLGRSITTEHYHDIGKYLFGFVFFWGYIAFSQYMLIWYANIPEETAWLVRRGATTAEGAVNGWTAIGLAVLVGKLLIPFAALLSRHTKRSRRALVFWAAWLLVFHWLDLFWLIGPELNGRVNFGLTELAALAGVGGLFVAAFVRALSRHALRPTRDPRLEESLAFENV